MKRPGLVIEAFRQLPHLRLRVVGGGELFDELKRTAPPNVEMVGPVTEEQLKKEYDGCIAAVFVSTREDFGYVPVEAYASGKPCIATNAAGFTETIVPGVTGLLVDEPVSVNAVKRAVCLLDEKTAKGMREACLLKAKEFDDVAFFREMDWALSVKAFGKDRCEDCGTRLRTDEERVCKSCWSHERRL